MQASAYPAPKSEAGAVPVGANACDAPGPYLVTTWIAFVVSFDLCRPSGYMYPITTPCPCPSLEENPNPAGPSLRNCITCPLTRKFPVSPCDANHNHP